MHRLSTSFVLGYHGCDKAVAEAVLAGEAFRPSRNDYDWLGEGIYFWEVNPQRGLDFAREVKRRQPRLIVNPAVVGAVIDLGLCLDCTTQPALEMLKTAHDSLAASVAAQKQERPINSGRWKRSLDCAVIQHLHTICEAENQTINTVRGVFVEGEEAYPGAGFRTKTHTQITVRNLACIKGVFRVPAGQLRTR